MLVVITISILLLCGLPLGELTMGGQYRVFPKKNENKGNFEFEGVNENEAYHN